MTIRDYVPVAKELRPSTTIDTQFGFIDLRASRNNYLINAHGYVLLCHYPSHTDVSLLPVVYQSVAFYSITFQQLFKNRTSLDDYTLLQCLKEYDPLEPIGQTLSMLVQRLMANSSK